MVEWKEILLVGVRHKFERASRENQDARKLWNEIKQTNREIWLGQPEIAIRWKAD
ncbi:hypothetical protein D3C83_255380 [compost metagenome]